MSYYLGVDIGTFESKGVIVDGGGRIVASDDHALRFEGADIDAEVIAHG